MAILPFPLLPEDDGSLGSDGSLGMDAGGVCPEEEVVPEGTAGVSARTNALIDRFLAMQAARAAADAAEIRILADAAAVVAEQQAAVRSGSKTGRGTVVVSGMATELPYRIMVAELAVAARVSERTVQIRLNDAQDLCARFPETVNALEAGLISRGHVAVIHTAGHPIDDDHARAVFEAACLQRATELSPGRLRPVADVLVARLNPRAMTERHTEAVTARNVWVRDLPDGMAELIATLPATLAHAVYDRLTRQAHTVSDTARAETAGNVGRHEGDAGAGAGAGADADAGAVDAADPAECAHPPTPDTRTVGQLRADILTDVLLTATPEHCRTGDGLDAIQAIVQVTIPVLTATGHRNEPVILAGHGPIDTPTALRLAGNASAWERVMTSPLTGQVLATDRYRPHPHLKRFLRARDEHCRFPGCRMPVWRCDIDHNHEHAHGGTTCEQNLAHLCRHHHVLKTETPWDVKNLGGGNLLWTSPTGRTYPDTPESTLRFLGQTDPIPPDCDAGADPPWIAGT